MSDTGKLVFFVDDDKLIINLMEYTFRSRHGIEVKSFYTGEECIDHLNEKPDLIVLDHFFSKQAHAKMTGLETLKVIRQIDKDVPVVMLTSQGNTDLIPEFIENGAKKYIAKDEFFIDSLINVIEEEVGKEDINY